MENFCALSRVEHASAVASSPHRFDILSENVLLCAGVGARLSSYYFICTPRENTWGPKSTTEYQLVSWLPLQRDFVGLNQTIYDSTWMPFVRLFSAQLQRDFEQLNRTLYYGYIFSVLTISSFIFFFGSSSIYKNANFQEFMWLFKHSKLNQITNVTQPRIV